MSRYIRVGSHLEDRSKLKFIFFTSNGKIIRTLDFFENIQVEESQSNNIASYTPIGRSGSLFSFLGAESRSFTVTFNLTLPNIIEHSRSINEVTNSYKTKLDKQKDYFKIFIKDNTTSINSSPELASTQDYDRRYNNLLDDDEQGVNFLKIATERGIAYNPEIITDRNKAIENIVYWVNLIRSSVVTNAKSPTEGPPQVRLTHGILYQNVPCLATAYNITVDDSAGYDMSTLLPRVLKVSMELSETRSNEEYIKGDLNFRDGIAGWESVIDEDIRSMDPGESIDG